LRDKRARARIAVRIDRIEEGSLGDHRAVGGSVMSKETYTPWDSAEVLDDDTVIIEYLQAALEEDDPELFVKAVGTVARAMGMTTVAQETELGRTSLYKALSGERDPRIGTVMKVLGALGVRLTVAPKVA